VTIAEVELDIFSGMPNPEWRLSETQAKTLLDRLSALSPTEECPRPGNLGYRGLIVRIRRETRQDTHVYIHRGCVEVEQLGSSAFFADPSRGLERYLVATGEPFLATEVLDAIESDLGTSTDS
jgi:hypothetical protein